MYVQCYNLLMVNPLHHIDIRRRIYKKHQKFPHPNIFVRYLDKWVSIFGAITSLAVLPQVIEIWSNQSSENVSFLTWTLFTLWCYTMLLYGIVHKAKPIIITYIIGSILHTMVVIGLILY